MTKSTYKDRIFGDDGVGLKIKKSDGSEITLGQKKKKVVKKHESSEVSKG